MTARVWVSPEVFPVEEPPMAACPVAGLVLPEVFPVAGRVAGWVAPLGAAPVDSWDRVGFLP